MKNFIKTRKILLFFCCFCIIFAFFLINFEFNFFQNVVQNKLCYAQNFENEKIFKFDVNGRIFTFKTDINNNNEKVSNIREECLKKPNETYEKLLSFGLTNKDALEYLCPGLNEMVKRLKKIIEVNEVSPKIYVNKNKCELMFSEGLPGIFLDEIDFYDKIKDQIISNNKNIFVKVKTQKYFTKDNIKSDYVEKSCFSTNFSNSSDSRKNNIKIALENFDGIILDEGEILSFNQITGERNEDAGYMQAKIISGGTFTEGFGGGVCQVSTTLYNACLLAGLEILEVHSHSLPVSYIEPSFDAMVNIGSSDLVVRNNTNGKIIFTTSSENDVCKVKIFGKKNKYKITRISEKTKIIKSEPEIIETDYKKYINYDLEIGQEKRLSYAKDGYSSKGYLNFYDENGTLIKTKQIRENTYSPTKGIILKREE